MRKPPTFFSVLLTCWFSFAPATAAPADNWPVPQKFFELPTPYGTLAVKESEYVYEARLQLNGELLDPDISGMLDIRYAFSMPKAQAALVAISKGNDTCPISYRWVIIKPQSYIISPEFGSCSEFIRVSADTSQLKLETPSRDAPNTLDTYVYDGQTLKRLNKRNQNGNTRDKR